MQAPVEIDIQGFEETAQIRREVTEHVNRLVQRFGRVTACRVALRAPSVHHRQGGLYEVGIRLALPDGREVNIRRTAQSDERHADLAFALNDAFRRARRQLQHHVQALQGRVKHHESASAATVVRLDPSGEFGFLETADGREIYFHHNAVLNGGFSGLTIGARVTFAEEEGEKGPQATTVKPLGKHSFRA